MTARKRMIQRVIYEEKPTCGRCGAGIVGVIPRRKDGKPLCRECAFELEEMRLKTGGKAVQVEEAPAPVSQEELQKRTALIVILALTVVFLLFRIYTLAPMFQAPKPLRAGATQTDALTDECIKNMWRLSRDLQNKDLPNVLPLCPKSGRQYIVADLEDDTLISCPTPGEHGLEKLSVSLNSPIPHAVAGEGP